MTAPVKRSQRALFREPSYVVLMIGIVLSAFGISSLVGGRHSVDVLVITGVGLAMVIPMRVVRSRSGRWP